MPIYLVANKYTPEGWANMIRNPSNREEAVRDIVASAGGRLLGFWFAITGEHDSYTVVEAPDEETLPLMTAVVKASGGVAIQSVQLVTAADMERGCQRAQSMGQYQSPDRQA
jgi:uncharacterized protein with GYD domain